MRAASLHAFAALATTITVVSACRKSPEVLPQVEAVATLSELSRLAAIVKLDDETRRLTLHLKQDSDADRCVKVTDVLEVTHEHKLGKNSTPEPFVIEKAGGIEKLEGTPRGTRCGHIQLVTKRDDGSTGQDSAIVFRDNGPTRSAKAAMEIDLSSVLQRRPTIKLLEHEPTVRRGEKVTFIYDGETLSNFSLDPFLDGNLYIIGRVGPFPPCLLGHSKTDWSKPPTQYCGSGAGYDGMTHNAGSGEVRGGKFIDVLLPKNLPLGTLLVSFNLADAAPDIKLNCALKSCTMTPPRPDWLEVQVEAAAVADGGIPSRDGGVGDGGVARDGGGATKAVSAADAGHR